MNTAFVHQVFTSGGGNDLLEEFFGRLHRQGLQCSVSPLIHELSGDIRFGATYLEDHPTYFDLFWLVIPVLLILPMGFITIKPPFGSIWENFCGTFSKDRRSTAKLGSCLKASCRSFRSTVPKKTCGTTLAVHV